MEKSNLQVGGIFRFELVRNGKVIDSWKEKNIVVDEGLTHLLDTTLHGTTQQSTWYLGIYEGNYTPVSTDTAANIASHSTESVAYDETFRPEWEEEATSNKEITNSANKATFTINATKAIYGAFMISDSTKNGTAGLLFAASKFTVKRDVVATDQLLVTYTVSASTT